MVGVISFMKHLFYVLSLLNDQFAAVSGATDATEGQTHARYLTPVGNVSSQLRSETLPVLKNRSKACSEFHCHERNKLFTAIFQWLAFISLLTLPPSSLTRCPTGEWCEALSPLQACVGCDGVPNSPLRYDCAGVCGGGGLACPAAPPPGAGFAGGGAVCPFGMAVDGCGACSTPATVNVSCSGCDLVPFSMATVCQKWSSIQTRGPALFCTHKPPTRCVQTEFVFWLVIFQFETVFCFKTL